MIRLVTYSITRPFFGMNIPIPIQSAYLRDYASRNNLTFSLPVTEVCFGGSFYALSNIFRALVDGEHFGAVSLLVLPLDNETVFFELLNFVSKKNICFHFPLEGFCGDSKSVISWREDFITLRRLSASINGNAGFLEKKGFLV
jgi:sporadic carbohydrate cluster protein (TIGR04323 family)